MKLHQLIAVTTGIKKDAENLLTQAHHNWRDATEGSKRTYEPLAEDGERVPPEFHIVKLRILDEIPRLVDKLSEYYDEVSSQELSNTGASADIVLKDGTVLAKSVPVGALLFLEKQITNLKTFVQHIPTLSRNFNWKWDEAQNCYVTEPTEKVRTAKMPHVVVKYEATDKHPAQTEVFTLDKAVGTYTEVFMSGAMPKSHQVAMLDRCTDVLEAVKKAREKANETEVTEIKVGKALLDHVFGR